MGWRNAPECLHPAMTAPKMPRSCIQGSQRDPGVSPLLLHWPPNSLLLSWAEHAVEVKPGSTDSKKQMQYFKALSSITISSTINNTCKKFFLNRYDFYLDGVSLNHFYPQEVCKESIFCAPFILPNIHHPCLLFTPASAVTNGTGPHPPLGLLFPTRDDSCPSLHPTIPS